MNSKAKNVTLTILALLVYVGLMVGFGFIWNLFWKVDNSTNLVYWISKSIVCVMVVIFSLIPLFAKADKGISALQLFFSVSLSLVPLLLRAVCMILVAGLYIAIILGIILVAFFAFTMLGLGAYAKGEGTKKI